MLKKIACGGLSSRVPALGGRIKHANLYTGGLDMGRGKKKPRKKIRLRRAELPLVLLKLLPNLVNPLLKTVMVRALAAKNSVGAFLFAKNK